jgi:hypothetical protein
MRWFSNLINRIAPAPQPPVSPLFMVPIESSDNTFAFQCTDTNAHLNTRYDIGELINPREKRFHGDVYITHSKWIPKIEVSGLDMNNIQCGNRFAKIPGNQRSICNDCTTKDCHVRFSWNEQTQKITSQCGMLAY